MSQKLSVTFDQFKVSLLSKNNLLKKLTINPNVLTVGLV